MKHERNGYEPPLDHLRRWLAEEEKVPDRDAANVVVGRVAEFHNQVSKLFEEPAAVYITAKAKKARRAEIALYLMWPDRLSELERTKFQGPLSERVHTEVARPSKDVISARLDFGAEFPDERPAEQFIGMLGL